jgi:hypothetical protein
VKRDRCRECGVELTLGPGAPCPLCGTAPSATNLGHLASPSEDQREGKVGASHQEGRREVADVASYQSDVQRLREQLRRLRSGAEAV